MLFITEIDRKYREVATFTVLDFDHVVPNGKTLILTEIGANAVLKPASKALIVWDPGGAQEEILLSTAGDTVQKTDRRFIGDGVRKMRIRLDNQEATTQTLGAYYLGAEV